MDGKWRFAALVLLFVSCCEGFSVLPTITISKRPMSNTAVQLKFSSSDQVRTLPLVEGNPYQLQCEREGSAAGSLQWLKGGVPVVDTSSVFVENANTGILVIMEFNSARDGANYSCTVGSVSANMMITAGNPVVIPAAEDDYRRGAVASTNRQTLTMFVDGEPTPTGFMWFFNGNILVTQSSPSIFVEGAEVILPRTLFHEQSGNYTLLVNNSVGVAAGSINLTVTLQPVLSLLPAVEVSVRANQNISITCVANVSVPPSTFHWVVNGAVVNQSGNGFILRDVVVDLLPGQEIQVASPTVTSSGTYRCVADNSYRNVMSSSSLEARVYITGLLPPTNFSVTPESDCSVQVMWVNQVESSAFFSVVDSDSFMVEIQYNITDGGPQIQPLLTAASSPTPTTIKFVQQNTTYMLRGRGLSVEYGDSDYSDWFGPFYAFTTAREATPSISSVMALEPGSLHVTWTSESNCYVLSFTVECSEDVVGGGSVEVLTSNTSATLSGLNSSSFYNCRVSARLSARSIDGNVVPVIAGLLSDAVRMYTLPAAPQSSPPPPKMSPPDSVTAISFIVTVEPLSDPKISHYQIIVLRLTSDSLPIEEPTVLYPSNASFSDCSTVNDPDGKGPFQPYVADEVPAAKLGPKFVVGGDGTEEGTRCNGPLHPGTTYTVFVRAYPLTLAQEQQQQQGGTSGRRRRSLDADKQYAVFSSSGYMSPVTTKMTTGPTQGSNSAGPNPTILVAVTVTVVILAVVMGTIVIALVVGGLVYKRHQRRRKYSPRSSSSSVSEETIDYYNMSGRPNGVTIEMKEQEPFEDPLDVPFEPSGSVSAENFKDHVEKYDVKRQLLFQEEFEWISKNSPWHEASASEDERNDSKNRYSNITAFDHSRVKLITKPGVECSDYINANYVTGYNRSREYIASQGPLEQTVEDFWRMIWEQNTTTIIMLTNIVELGKIKCTQYWPISSTTMYGDIAVTLENTHPFPDYIIRTLKVEMYKTDETRRVLQFHYTKWPDYGTPKLAAPLLNFLKIVHEAYNSEEEEGPMLVHCSAGVGRSGTVLTIDYCLQQLRNEGVVSVRQFVQKMREERNYMVQTDQQYTFIHYAVLEAITYGDTSFELDKFMTSYRDLQQGGSSDGKFVLEDEFHRLGRVKTMVKKSSFQNRIRIKGAPQRHFHSSFHGGSTSGSIQQCLGHFMDSYNQSSLFLVTEGPDERSANRFWEMVWDNDCRLIVMLTPIDDVPFEYWPSEEHQFGSIKVVVESESAEHLYTCRNIRLVHAKVEGLTHNVIHYQYMGWTNNFMPRVSDFVSFFCCVLQARRNMPENSKIMVHDIASLGPAGIFCSLFHCIQRVQIERVIDIFQAVQYMQLQRPGCVSTLKDYVFIYDCVYDYLVKNT